MKEYTTLSNTYLVDLMRRCEELSVAGWFVHTFTISPSVVVGVPPLYVMLFERDKPMEMSND